MQRRTASADIFLFPSATDTFGQVILEAQASGLPVVAVAEGGPLSLIDDGVNGLLCEPVAERLADTVLELAGSPLLREHLARGGLAGASASARGSARSSVSPPATDASCRVRLAGAGPCGIAARAGRPARIAVALHDIEPATFERCALIRDWLDDHGVDRVTLLVIPAATCTRSASARPEMVRWLNERRVAGDSIAQHGFQHQQLRRGALARPPRPARDGRGAEFVGLDDEETRRAVDAGWRVLKLAGVEPDGFVAPAYAYTPALRRAAATQVPLVGRARCACTVRAWSRTRPARSGSLQPGAWAPTALCAVCLSVADPHREPLVRRHAAPGPTPRDLQHTRHMLALEWVLGRTARQRQAITFQEIVCAERAPEGARVLAPQA